MTADRPYRRALTVSVARAELMDGRGRQFDADVVDAFLDYLDAQSTPGGAAGSRGAAGVPTAA
jgi:HD-GYP domain-containing protein (c-di-GMP phosphodiesterase class II)